jgi:hypothetical protein
MDTTVILDQKHFKAAAAKARELGTTPAAYIESLIDSASRSFDEILAPVRADFRRSGMTEDELDVLVSGARKAIHAKAPRKRRK